jgi:serine/threonine protein kinase
MNIDIPFVKKKPRFITTFKVKLKKIKEEAKIGKYFLKKECDNKSGFGDIFIVIDEQEEEYIMKVQKKKIKKRNYILQEYEIYRRLYDSNCNYISNYHVYFTSSSLKCLVLNKFDVDLKRLFKNDRIFFYKYHKKFLTNIFKILEDIHNKDIIHGDIKFSNLMYNFKEDKIYIIDFGCSCIWRKKYIEHTKKNRRISGTLRYASLKSHKGIQLNNYNDIESLLYAILEIELYPRTLLWKGIGSNKSTIDRWDLIFEIKKNFLKNYKNIRPKKMRPLFKYYVEKIKINKNQVNYDEFIKIIDKIY